jgi:hypothetical protein
VVGTQGAPHTAGDGKKYGIGGFYCCFTVRFESWPAIDSRFFIGVSDLAGANMAATNASASPANNYLGLMHNDNNGANEIRVVSSNAGAKTDVAISSSEVAPTVATGRILKVEIFGWANRPEGTISLQAWDLQEGRSICNVTGLFAQTAFVGPQCVISNGLTGGNTPALGLANMHYFVGD